MTEDLRAQLRAELNNERPPPLGDVVGAALREGHRVQRRRRRALSVAAGSVGVFAVVLAGGVAANSEPRKSMQAADSVVLSSPSVSAVPVPPDSAARKITASPGSVPTGRTAPTSVAPGRTLAIHSGVDRAAGPREKATTGAMLHLLTQLLPAGRTSNAAVSGTGERYVQIYLDRGDGPGMVRLIVGQLPAKAAPPPRGGTATVSIEHVPDNCLQDTVVVSRWPDGTAVQLDVASCLAGNGRTNPPGQVALTVDEAVEIAADPRWGVTMDGDLVKVGEARYGQVPVFVS
ncbi:hypothetical protein M1L60_03120 [Actinoplanes sp. TRM 88003]|uniref:Uncharacterized protein n=1 Tax=Paractinoplanes aksuensis TaxID=2939490 RepID=A0ABT1DGF9_9ACTN|nr:hypothetical protein [Actinoplanes aksuensis]MCO8269578.1 hypothetical protein [Actinoplanes aksuensis]